MKDGMSVRYAHAMNENVQAALVHLHTQVKNACHACVVLLGDPATDISTARKL